MKKNFLLKISNFLFLMIIQLNVFSLEYIDVFTKFSDSFSSFVDKNEGSTTFPSLNIPSGGKEESLGSAYTAVSDDIGFFDHNPAASATLQNTEVAIFHNSWIADSNVETIASTWRKNDFGFGLKFKCFYVPFTEYNDFGQRVASNYYSETTGTFNISYNFFKGYYFTGLSVGANLKAGWRSIPDYTNRDTGALIKDSGLSQSGLALAGDFGLLMRFNLAKFFADRNPNFNIGISLLNAGVSLAGFSTAQGVKIEDSLPTEISCGISYRFIKPVCVALNFNQPINFLDFSKSKMWSAGIGLDFNITDFLEIMAGFQLKGANPRISLGTQFSIKKISLNLNYTFDLTSSVNPVNHFSVGAKINLGDQGRYSKELLAEGFYNDGVKFYANDKLDDALAAWEKCLELNPSFTPARRGIKLIQESRQVFERVITIQKLN